MGQGSSCATRERTSRRAVAVRASQKPDMAGCSGCQPSSLAGAVPPASSSPAPPRAQPQSRQRRHRRRGGDSDGGGYGGSSSSSSSSSSGSSGKGALALLVELISSNGVGLMFVGLGLWGMGKGIGKGIGDGIGDGIWKGLDAVGTGVREGMQGFGKDSFARKDSTL